MYINRLPTLCFLLAAVWTLPTLAKVEAGKPIEVLICLDNHDEQNMAQCTELAERGDAAAQNTLGKVYYRDALLAYGNHTKARLLFEAAAAQGLADAQYNLGAMYRDEFNNFPIAMEWFEKAAAQGHLDAYTSLGYLYEYGSGGDAPRMYTFDAQGQNIDPSVAEYREMAGLYFALPETHFWRTLFPMTEFGQGIEQDYSKAFAWYQKAAAQGHALGQTRLAFLYLMGLGVEQDEQKAFELYQQAAAQGCLPALNSLGYLYVQGIGTDEDAVKGFNALVKAYQLKPTWYRETILNRVQGREWSNPYNLQYTAIPSTYKAKPYFERSLSSDEDWLYYYYHHVSYLYSLDMEEVKIANLTSGMRPTMNLRGGGIRPTQDELKVMLYLNRAVQGGFTYMTLLYEYYEQVDVDEEKAALWKLRAIKMGEALPRILTPEEIIEWERKNPSYRIQLKWSSDEEESSDGD